jgi:hypothetical protein
MSVFIGKQGKMVQVMLCYQCSMVAARTSAPPTGGNHGHAAAAHRPGSPDAEEKPPDLPKLEKEVEDCVHVIQSWDPVKWDCKEKWESLVLRIQDVVWNREWKETNLGKWILILNDSPKLDIYKKWPMVRNSVFDNEKKNYAEKPYAHNASEAAKTFETREQKERRRQMERIMYNR